MIRYTDVLNLTEIFDVIFCDHQITNKKLNDCLFLIITPI